MSDNLPSILTDLKISPSQWMTLTNSLYPGAHENSVVMVIDYCRSRGLDPLKKPCHIVPMSVKNAATGVYEWRDVVMPGIYEYRTTAQRTGEYMGHAVPSYGNAIGDPTADPEWCDFTVYRWNDKAKQRAEYPVRVYFREVVALKKDGTPNERWKKAPIQMLTKCAEAAALRAAFPDELGGESTAEEMEGRVIESSATEYDWTVLDQVARVLMASLESTDDWRVLETWEGLNAEQQGIFWKNLTRWMPGGITKFKDGIRNALHRARMTKGAPEPLAVDSIETTTEEFTS